MSKEETAEERRERWMEREAKKVAEEEPEKVRCAECGREAEKGEYIMSKGRILCSECYANELEEAMDMGAAEGTGAG